MRSGCCGLRGAPVEDSARKNPLFQYKVHIMRSISFTNKKPCGIPRRMRALDKWARSFEGRFPDDLYPERRYWNVKLPVNENLVEGRHATKQVRIECAQRLIDACHRLMLCKPESAQAFRVTCMIALPDMFTSEVCIYTDEDYFRLHTSPARSDGMACTIVGDRSLAAEWALELPDSMHELGRVCRYHYQDNRGHGSQPLVFEQWYYGEVT